MRIVMLGTGGPLPDPERGGSSIVMSVGGRHYLFDCGQGATRQLVRANVDPADVGVVFLSHLHYDHVVDFPYFVLSSWICDRQRPFTVVGPKGARHFVEHLFTGKAFRDDIEARIQYPRRQGNRFALDPDVRECEPGVVFEDDRVRVSAVYVEHIPREISPCFGLRLDCDEGSVVFSGDTAPCDSIVELAKGVDLLIHECTFPEEAIEFRKKAGIGTWSHTSPLELGRIAATAEVKQLVATHFASWSTTHPVVKKHLAPHMPVDAIGPHMLDRVAADIRRSYKGPLALAHDLMRIDL